MCLLYQMVHSLSLYRLPHRPAPSTCMRPVFRLARPLAGIAFRRSSAVYARPVLFSSCSDSTCTDPTHAHVAKAVKPDAATDCWSCGSCVNHYEWFCKKCEYIQPSHGEQNLFRLFGLYVSRRSPRLSWSRCGGSCDLFSMTACSL